MASFEIIPGENNQVISLELAKKHLKLDAEMTEEDELIELLIATAQSSVENYTSAVVGVQKMLISTGKFETVVFESSVNDAVEKVEIYLPGSDETSVLEDTAYSLSKSGLKNYEVRFNSTVPVIAERADAVLISLTRGYSAENCPAPIKQAMLLMIGDLYERREDRPEVGYNTAVNNLLRPYKKW